METHVNNRAKTRVEVINLLRSRAITPTEQRIEIGQLLFNETQHITADILLEKVNKGRNKVSKATVYNTLGLFAQKGLIREVIVDPNRLFYDTNLEPHHHFYYSDTERLEDVSAEQVNINKLPDLPEGMDIEGIDVIIRVRPATK
jgi:Fur family iron response transcriptional regulator